MPKTHTQMNKNSTNLKFFAAILSKFSENLQKSLIWTFIANRFFILTDILYEYPLIVAKYSLQRWKSFSTVKDIF